jgi:hypothetical protein
MATRLVHLVVDAIQPGPLAQFWADALGWEVAADEDGEFDVWPAGYRYPDPVALPLVFAPVPEPKTGKNRVHLDLASESHEHHAEQVRRLLELGAVPIDIGQGDVPWRVLADPEGNEFCVLEPRGVYRDTGPVAAVVVDCAEPAAVAGFWRLATGWTPASSTTHGMSFRSPEGVGPYLELLPTAEPKVVKNRIHLDVAPYPDDELSEAVSLLLKQGAVPEDVGQGDVPWSVLADPQGTEFCVVSPR